MKKIPDTTANVVLAGATTVREISLRTTQLRLYREKARAMAIHAAQEKAAALAAELGVKIGKPYAITEIPDTGANIGSNVFNNVQQVTPPAQPGDGRFPRLRPVRSR